MDDSMEDIQPVNLFPEKRRLGEGQTDTSLFFTRSLRTANQEDYETQEQTTSLETKKQKQGVLAIANGHLTIKKPLINPIPRDDKRRTTLAGVAQETRTLLPGLLATRPDVTTNSFLCRKETLDPTKCPHLPIVKVRVVDVDTIDAALTLQNGNNTSKPVAILNMANAQHAGGGWQHGAMAQEEAICYRSSLSKTLHREHYPIPDDAAIYSPTVMIIRENLKDGHNLLDFRKPRQLNVISVISCAAICQPSLNRVNGKICYQNLSDMRSMKEKMRVVLRTAIRNRHRRVVLGAFGCGAFANPNHVVAKMWEDVLKEAEFTGGYWTDVLFAVLGGGRDDNYQVFHDQLDGLTV